jgi:hypothetical protein
MHSFAAAGASFLIAVLWFDLMFDVQVRNRSGEVLPPDLLDSISAYYKRVTTDAKPMSNLIALVMILTLGALVVEIVRREVPLWLSIASLLLAASAICLAALRIVSNAVRLGSGIGTPEERSRVARSIYRDHVFCLVAMIGAAALQLSVH